MAFPVHLKSLFSAYVDHASDQEMMTSEVLEKKISEIDANQIEFIATKLISLIPPFLGPVAKMELDQATIQSNNSEVLSQRECMMLMMQHTACEQVIKLENQVFFSNLEIVEFQSCMLPPIKIHIEEAFSTPLGFLESGMLIQLSVYKPEEILRAAVQKMGIKITAADVPRKYCILLKLDKDRSEDRSTLVFVLSQLSNGVEFSKQIFTI